MAFEPVKFSAYGYTTYPQRSVSELALALSQEENTVESHSAYCDASQESKDNKINLRSHTNRESHNKIPIQINYQKISQDDPVKTRSLVNQSNLKLSKLPKNKSFDGTQKLLKKNEETSRRIRSFSSLHHQNHDINKTRKISSPEMQDCALFDRRCSLESHELKSKRLQMLLARHGSSYFHLEDSSEAISVVDSGSSLIDINENTITTPTSRSRKLSNIFRRKSVVHSKAPKENDRNRKHGASNRISYASNDLDVVIRERDRALEEWGRSATKCEELVDELEFTLSQLIIIKSDRDEKTEEFRNLIMQYDIDMDDREKELDDFQEELSEAQQLLAVARTERTEAFDQRDELIQQTYACKQEADSLRDELSDAQDEHRNLSQKCASLEEQVILLKKERDDALKLWNTTVEERKKLHDEQILLTHARDESLRRTFGQLEEISVLKSERNQLRRHIENIKRGVGYHGDSQCLNIDERRYDSGFSSVSFPDKTSEGGASTNEALVSTLEEDDWTNKYEEIAICIDTLDSRHGLKLDNAIDVPHVMVAFVTSQLEQKWNIKKHDRIICVNGASVSRADKKTVERLIRDTAGRTISLVLRREILLPGKRNQADIEIGTDKQAPDMQYMVHISNVNEDFTVNGMLQLKKGDRITKINSQDINDVMSIMIKKLGKRTSGKATLRIVRKSGFTEEDLMKHQSDAMTPTKPSLRHTMSFNSFPRRKKSTTSSDFSVARSLFNDISSLFSEESEALSEDTSLSSRKTGAIPDVQIDALPELDFSHSPKHRPKSLAIKNYLHANTLLLDNAKSFRTSSNNSISIQRSELLPSLRPSPRPTPRLSSTLRRSISTIERKNDHVGLASSNENFSSLTLPRSNSSCASMEAISETPFSNLPGYATLPRRYRRKAHNDDKKQTTRVIRMEKHANEIIGITITGGNKVGIFVKELAPGSVAERSGLKVGDRILHLNSSDLSKATLDFATRSLLNHRSCIQLRVEVAYYDNYEDLIVQKPYESIYVRCLQQYTAINTDELSFEIGDVFHVTDTLYGFDIESFTWSWYGSRAVKNTLSNVEGALPRIETYIEEPKSPTPMNGEIHICTDGRGKKKLLRLNKSAQDLKKWLAKKPSFITKKRKVDTKRTYSFNDLRRNVFYEILLEEPIIS